MLAGCAGRTYERIELERPGQDAAKVKKTEIVIGETAGVYIAAAGDAGAADGAAGDAGAGIAADEAENGARGPGESGEADAGDSEITLLFGGDVLLSSHVLNAYDTAGGIHGVLDEGYRSAIGAADFFMVNQEFPFSNRGKQAEDKEYTFRLPPERVALLQEMGIDGVTLANNHALDFGVEALLDSCETLDGAGIARTGAGADLEAAKQPVRIADKGQEIAIIGATRVIPQSDWAAWKNHGGMLATYDPAILLGEIQSLKGSADYVVVYVHWGVEKEEMPKEYQRTLAQQYIDAGADLVVGSHPHVLQGIEYYKGKPIVYSLGNFVFGSSIPKTMLLEVKLTLKAEGAGSDTADAGAGEITAVTLRLIPGTSGLGYTKMLTDSARLQAFYQHMERLSFGVCYQGDGTVAPQEAVSREASPQEAAPQETVSQETISQETASEDQAQP